MVEAAEAAVESAQRALDAVPEPGSALLPSDVLEWLESEGRLDLADWPIEKWREMSRQLIAEVRLSRGRGPIHERVAIRWAGHDEFDSDLAAAAPIAA